MTDISYCFHCYCYWLTSDRTWFSVRWLGRGSGYVWNPPKAWTTSLSISFNNIGLWLTHVIGVVWDASTTGGNWCSLTKLIMINCLLYTVTDCIHLNYWLFYYCYLYSYMSLCSWWSDCFIIILHFIPLYAYAPSPSILHTYWVAFWWP